MTTENFCFYLQNRLIQTSQIGGQQYNDNSPFSIPSIYIEQKVLDNNAGKQQSQAATDVYHWC
jgi:hypothetical protein